MVDVYSEFEPAHERNEMPAFNGGDDDDDNALDTSTEPAPLVSRDDPYSFPDNVPTSARLQQVSDNQVCFDCSCEHPQWVNVSYAVFLCAACATIHAEFGLLVKPFSDQCLTIVELMLLWRTGNKAANQYWLPAWTALNAEYIHPKTTKDDRTKYIIDKYRGKWMFAEMRAQLGRDQHAFSTQPAAYYGPQPVAPPLNLPVPSPLLAPVAAAPHYNYDSVITQTQQLSIRTPNVSKDQKPAHVSTTAVNQAPSSSGKENLAPSFVMHNTGKYSKKKAKKHR